jgi:hypothetical protein
MMTPKTPEQLAGAIETLVASYLDEVRRVAQQALVRGLCQQLASAPKSRADLVRPVQRRKQAERRSPEQLAKLADKLHQLVCARPGESMATLAVAMEETAVTLHLPMTKLRAEWRVRSVGERHLTRYFPAVVRAPKSGS